MSAVFFLSTKNEDVNPLPPFFLQHPRSYSLAIVKCEPWSALFFRSSGNSIGAFTASTPWIPVFPRFPPLPIPLKSLHRSSDLFFYEGRGIVASFFWVFGMRFPPPDVYVDLAQSFFRFLNLLWENLSRSLPHPRFLPPPG